MSNSPKISIIVPAYNHRAYLPARIESISKQTVQDVELILLDDASTDGSQDYLRSVAEEMQATFIPNTKNTGSPFAQWNRGIAEASGEYVWLAESDDLAEPVFLETLVAELDQNSQAGIACCNSIRIDEDANELQPLQDSVGWDRDVSMTGEQALRSALYINNAIVSASAVVFRRSVYEEAGPSDSTLSLAGDWLQWSKMLAHSDLIYLHKPLNYTRIHTQSRRADSSTYGTLEIESLRVQHFIRSKIRLDFSQRKLGAHRYAVSWLQGLRAGRYSGLLRNHVIMLLALTRAHVGVGTQFALHFPYAFIVWFIKGWFQRLSKGEQQSGD